MMRRIVVGLIIFTLLALLVLWLFSGGPQSLFKSAKGAVSGLADPYSLTPADVSGFRLPWQPVELFPTININSSTVVDVPYNDPTSYAGIQEKQQLAELEAQYDSLAKRTSNEKTFGTPSPYAGMVQIASNVDALKETDRTQERVELTANFSNAGPVDITGWSLESALTRARLYLPRAAAPFITGTTNTLGIAYLEPGASALIVSGVSPVGISFRENICSGYLQQFQTFSPPLYEECPSPSSVLPLTSDNLSRYGDGCFDALATLPQCRFPQIIPGEITAACRNFLSNELSYNGCVASNRFRSAFHGNIWRLYLNSPAEIWRNSHDAIRLLDAEGKTVDVLLY